ncbi:hypothetical protein [Brevibacterium luteolum]|uniref:hypothetical protein n=1 Tax=Brevibacterium luteolum TaxID=199591 RepID=UPI003B67B3A2
MPLKPVPWATGNGADNPVEGARLALYAATKGARGVAGPGDMRVTALPVPGGAVRVHTGGSVTPNDYIPGGGGQAYAMREESHSDIPIPATGSSGGATRYLVARVDDPQYAGPEPADPVNGPYNRYALVGSETGHAYPHVPLAKITQPANTATITPDMITDIRTIALARREERVFARPRVQADNSPQNWLTAKLNVGGEYFPGGGESPNGFTVRVPDWAVMMIVEADWLSVRYQGEKSSWGLFWMEYGTEFRNRAWPGFANNKHNYEFSTQGFAWDQSEGPTYRTNWRLMDTRPVPAKLRGKDVAFIFKAAIDDASGALSNVASMNSISGLGCKLTFIEAPTSDWQGAN